VQQDVGFDARRVRRLEVLLAGSGAIDNVRFEPGPNAQRAAGIRPLR
jgi:hypothetical protein